MTRKKSNSFSLEKLLREMNLILMIARLFCGKFPIKTIMEHGSHLIDEPSEQLAFEKIGFLIKKNSNSSSLNQPNYLLLTLTLGCLDYKICQQIFL